MSLYDNYFTVDKSNGKRCNVKGCGWFKKYCNTTTDMRRHLKNEHPKLWLELEEKQERIRKKKEERNNFYALSQLLIPTQDFFKPKTCTTFSGLSEEKTTELDKTVVDFIADNLEPFSIIDGRFFRSMISGLNDKYNLKSSRYYSDTVLPARYKEIEAVIKKELAKAEFISLTVDEWSSEDLKHCLVSVTARIIGPDFKPYSFTIGAVPLKRKHNGSNMADHLKQFLDNFGIDQKKLARIVRDGATSMIGTSDLLDMESLTCFAHSLQKVVDDGLKVLLDKETSKNEKNVIERVKQFVRKVKTSSVIEQRFEELQDQFDVPQHELQTNVEVRWSSLFLMLKRFCEQQNVVTELMLDSSLKMPQFNTDDWNTINLLIEVLQVIDEATELIQGDSTSTSVILPTFHVLLQTFTEQIDHDHHFKDAIAAMKKSLENRLVDWLTNKHLVLATISDPRFKDFYFPPAFIDLYINWIAEDFAVPQRIEEEVVPVENLMSHDLYEKYEAVVDNSKRKETNFCLIRNEIRQYLKQPRHPKTSSVAEYWVQHEKIYPKIAVLYKKYNCSPATCADSERLFSKAELIISELRLALGDDTLKMLLFLAANLPNIDVL